MDNIVEVDNNLEGVDDNLARYIPDALKFLVDGYVDYSKEIVQSRALPGIDGLKPSQRRIIYAMGYLEKLKEGELTKSANIVGTTMKLHPHGDASIYDTLVRMIDSAEYMNVPYLKGKGTYGKVYGTEPAAASRYTECALAPITAELFRDMHGATTVPSYDNKLQEPLLLPTSFPSILCNAIQGIAVGLASNIPSFNFHELNKAVIEYIETGTIANPLIPDFTTGGYYVHDEKELEKLMETGKAKVKLRGKWHIEGKTIVIDELPYYTTTTEIMRQIKEVKNIYDVRDESDRGGLKLCIECTNKMSVDEVLTEVLKVSNLQMQISTNVVVIVNNAPKVIGVKEVLYHWIEFRKSILQKTLKVDLEATRVQIEKMNVLVDLLGDKTKRDTLIDTLMKSKHKAIVYLNSLYPDYKGGLEWIIKMSLESLSEVDSKIRKLERLKEQEAELVADLEDIGRVIVRQLKEINTKYKFPRKTESTLEDYVFEKGNEVVKATPVPVVVVEDGKFIKKLMDNPVTAHIEGVRCMSDDVISFADNQGRLLRVHLENIEFSNPNDRGIYLPVYFEIEDDFEIVFWDVVSDKKVGYVYNDGYASVIDYSEWLDAKRCTKIIQNGVSDKVTSIISEIDFNKAYLLMITENGEFGFASTVFKHKSRTARTKLVDVKKGDRIVTVLNVSYNEVLALVTNPDKYIGKITKLKAGDTFNTELFNQLVQNR